MTDNQYIKSVFNKGGLGSLNAYIFAQAIIQGVAQALALDEFFVPFGP